MLLAMSMRGGCRNRLCQREAGGNARATPGPPAVAMPDPGMIAAGRRGLPGSGSRPAGAVLPGR